MEPNSIVSFFTLLFGSLGLPSAIKSSCDLLERITRKRQGASVSETEHLTSQITEIREDYAKFVSAHESLAFWKEGHECFQDLHDALYDNIFIQANHKEVYQVDVALLIDVWKNRARPGSILVHKSLDEFRKRIVSYVQKMKQEDDQCPHDFAQLEFTRAVTARNGFIKNVEKTDEGFTMLDKAVKKGKPDQQDLYDACICISDGVRSGLSNADAVLYNTLMMLRLAFTQMKGMLGNG